MRWSYACRPSSRAHRSNARRSSFETRRCDVAGVRPPSAGPSGRPRGIPAPAPSGRLRPRVLELVAVAPDLAGRLDRRAGGSPPAAPAAPGRRLPAPACGAAARRSPDPARRSRRIRRSARSGRVDASRPRLQQLDGARLGVAPLELRHPRPHAVAGQRAGTRTRPARRAVRRRGRRRRGCRSVKLELLVSDDVRASGRVVYGSWPIDLDAYRDDLEDDDGGGAGASTTATAPGSSRPWRWPGVYEQLRPPHHAGERAGAGRDGRPRRAAAVRGRGLHG